MSKTRKPVFCSNLNNRWRVLCESQHVHSLSNEGLCRFFGSCRVVPGSLEPSNEHLSIGVHPPSTQSKGIDVTLEFRNRKSPNVSELPGFR